MIPLLFDTETTDVGEDAQIIEAAWLHMPDLAEFLVNPDERALDCYHERFKPTVEIKPGAMAVHGIIPEDLDQCRPHTEFSLPHDVGFLIGHNIDFDWRVCGEPDVRRICTLALSRYLHPTLESHNQSAMLYHYMSDERVRCRHMLKNAHAALDDIQNCAILLTYLLRDLRRTGHTLETWDDLWHISEVARVPTVMPFGKHRGERIDSVPADYKRWLLRQPDVCPYLRTALTGGRR